MNFQKELESLINRHSMENGSNTPDFILAAYMGACMAAFDAATKERDYWMRKGPQDAPEHLRMQIGYLAGELQISGDTRSTPEIVESAAKATAPMDSCFAAGQRLTENK